MNRWAEPSGELYRAKRRARQVTRMLENQTMKEQTKKFKSAKGFPRHSITWLFPLVAIAYFDASVAILCIMFLVPFIILMIFFANKISKRFSRENQFKLLLSFLSVVLTCVILGGGYFHYFSPEKMFEDVVASPVPESIKILKKSGQLSAMGISSFYIVFIISSADFKYILGAKEFKKKNLSNIAGRKPKLYSRALNEAKKWINDTAELYVKDDTNSSYRCSVLVTNKNHDKIYYRIF